MYWYPAAIMLENKQFHRLTCNHAEINLYFTKIDEDVKIIALIDATKRYYYESSALTNLKDELERKFLLRGSKNVEVLFVIYSKNLAFYKNMLDSGLMIWLVDVSTNRLMIYENQPDDFLQLKHDFEESLKVEVAVKKKNYPYVTIALAVINIAVFLFMYVFSRNGDRIISIGANDWSKVFIDKEYFRLLTCMFLHSDINHLINNMISLAVVGNETECRLGHRHFSVLYLVSGLLSSLASAYYHMHKASISNIMVISIGASGAIFGIYGAYMVISLLSNKATGRPISIPRVLIVTLLLLSSGFTDGNIDNMAHLAGLIVGIIISFIYCKCDKSILKY